MVARSPDRWFLAPQGDRGAFSPTVALSVAFAAIFLFFVGLVVAGIMRADEVASTSTSVETTTSTTAIATTSIEPAEPVGPRRLQPSRVSASSQLSDDHGPENLVDGDVETAWRDAALHGDDAVLTFEFDSPVEVYAVVVSGIADDRDFHRSFRIRGFRLHFGEAAAPVEGELPDSPEPHRIDLGGIETEVMTMEVLSTYPGETQDEEPATEELAVSEIEFLGRPPR